MIAVYQQQQHKTSLKQLKLHIAMYWQWGAGSGSFNQQLTK
jgi:hypothetical protein